MFFKNMQKYKSIDLKLKHKKHDLHTWLLILCDQKKGLSLRLREVVAVREIFFFGSLTIWSVFQKVDASFD